MGNKMGDFAEDEDRRNERLEEIEATIITPRKIIEMVQSEIVLPGYLDWTRVLFKVETMIETDWQIDLDTELVEA